MTAPGVRDVATTPSWAAGRNGLPGDFGAVEGSAQINQLLGTHPASEIYQGTTVVSPNGTGASYWPLNLGVSDYDQPFTMSGTVIGRVTVPVLPVGSGADLKVSLCPDSSGSPGAPITSTRIPASWISQLSALSGTVTSSGSPFLGLTGNPLAVPQFNALQGGVWTTNSTWAYPSVSGTSTLFPATWATYGNWLVSLAGEDASHNLVAYVYAFQYQGGTTLGLGVPQPSLPQIQTNCAAVLTADTAVCLGGSTGSSAAIANVYTASFNPSTGVIGAWSQQASLPQGVVSAETSATAWNDTVYLCGGTNAALTTLNTVYWTTIQNGQITAWHTTTMPAALLGVSANVIGNLLTLTGGQTSGGVIVTSTYYAPINSDGSLGSWQTGPSSPIPTEGGNVNIASGIVIDGGWNNGTGLQTPDVQTLTFGATGPASWQRQTAPVTPSIDTSITAVFATGAPGQYQNFILSPSSYVTQTLTVIPTLSVPLPATGLSNGATYHILLQQRGGDAGLSSYLLSGTDTSALSANALKRTRGTGGSWSTYTSGQAIPVTVYNNTASGPVWHTWEDTGARTSTLIYDTTPDARLIGICESTYQPGAPLNAQPTFLNGTGYWNAIGGALTQSTAQIQGGIPTSGLLTPAGSPATQAYIECEQEPVFTGDKYTAQTWVYSPPGYGSVAVGINWYTSAGAYISTSLGTLTSVAAATWTSLTLSGSTAPATAAKGTVLVVEQSTPPVTATLYISTATLSAADGQRVAGVRQITYSGTWPGTGTWPPTGAIQLA